MRLRTAATALLLAGLALLPGCRKAEGPKGGPGREAAAHRRRPQGHDPRVLAHHPRRRDQGAARPRREGRRGRDPLEGPAARGRPRAAGAGGRVLREPGRRRDRPRPPRREGARPAGRGGEAARGPDRDHRLGPRLRPDRELRRHRQRARAARWPPTSWAASWAARATSSCCATRRARPAPPRARRGFSPGSRPAGPASSCSWPTSTPGATVDTAKRASENLLNRHGRDLQGVFLVNETSTGGMLLALQDAGLAGKVKLVGFDGTPALVSAMRAGQLHGFVLQNPFRMAALGVETMVDHLLGQDRAEARRHRRPRGDAREPRHPRGAGAPQPAPRHVPQARRMTAVLRLAGIVQRFGATVALDGAVARGAPGRGARAPRRERRRQEHAPRHPRAACSCRSRARWRWTGRPTRPARRATRAFAGSRSSTRSSRSSPTSRWPRTS